MKTSVLKQVKPRKDFRRLTDAEREVLSGMRASENPLEWCLNILEQFFEKGIDPRTDALWNAVDGHYQRMVMIRERNGVDVSEYRERYSRLIDKIDSYGLEKNVPFRDNTYDTLQARRADEPVRVLMPGRGHEGEYDDSR